MDNDNGKVVKNIYLKTLSNHNIAGLRTKYNHNSIEVIIFFRHVTAIFSPDLNYTFCTDVHLLCTV